MLLQSPASKAQTLQLQLQVQLLRKHRQHSALTRLLELVLEVVLMLQLQASPQQLRPDLLLVP